MHDNFDPRIWNIVTGAALLAAGCSTRVAGNEAGDTGETAESAETPEAPPECVTDADCPGDFYYCQAGECYYVPHHDGWIPYYDCYSDSECDIFEICEFGYCESAGAPPPDCEPAQAAVPIQLDAPVLHLTFADVDGDGDDELVAQTASELLVIEGAGAAITANPLAPGSITQMVAGEFDGQPGEDLLCLIGASSTTLYPSNGDGTFGDPVSQSTPIDLVAGLIPGDYDGAPPTDVFGWGSTGAYVSRNGMVTEFAITTIIDYAVTLEFDHPAAGYFARSSDFLRKHDLDGDQIGMVSGLDGPESIAAMQSQAGAVIAHLAPYNSGWTEVRLIDVFGLQQEAQWPVPGFPDSLLAGDLDGDGFDDLVFNGPAGLNLQLDPAGEGDCWDTPIVLGEGVPRGVAFGDHDGDGDQELAVLTELGELALIDGE